MAGPALALGEPAQEHGAFIQGLCYQQEGNSGAIVPILRARPAFCPPVLLVAPSAALGEITNSQTAFSREASCKAWSLRLLLLFNVIIYNLPKSI